MKTRSCFLTASVLAAASCAWAAPKIDGRIDPGEWDGARKFDKFTILNTNRPAPPCEAMLLHDAKGVYVAFRVPVANGRNLRSKITKRDGRVFTDDSVELMIAPSKGRDRYMHFTVNSIGTVCDAYADQGGFVRDEKWDCKIVARTFVGKDFWSAEMFIPYSAMELGDGAAEVWGFNFCHNISDPPCCSSILPRGEYHVSGAFIPVEGFRYDFSRSEWRITPPRLTVKQQDGKFLCTPAVTLANNSRKEGKVVLDVTLSGPDIAASETVLALSPGSSTTVRLPAIALKAPGQYKATVTLADPVTRRPSIRRTFPLDVRFNPVRLTLIDPHYRDTVFASQKLDKVRYSVTAADKTVFPVTTGIADAAGKTVFSKEITADAVVEFPVAELPDGKYTVFARSGDNAATHPLRKVAHRTNEVWRDKQGFWRADGKRFFMISEWCNVHVPGVNLSNMKKPAESRLLDMTLMNRQTNPARAAFHSSRIEPAVAAKLRKVIAANAGDEKLFARYLADEPEVFGATVPALAQAAAIIRDEDPYHPLVVSNNTIVGMRDYSESSEINGLHCYPNPEKGGKRTNFARIVAFMDQVKAMNDTLPESRKQSIFYLQQGFNYGDWGRVNSRIPTFDEVRTQFLMTTIMGGRGIMFWNRSTEHYPELYIGMPEVGREFAALHDVLCEDDQPGALTQGRLRTMIKKHKGKLWIFAASAQVAPFEHEFDFPELGDRVLAVWREGRRIPVQNGKFRDRFGNFDARVYTADLAADTLPTVSEVEKRIAEANAGRRKPGNLAFQMLEDDHLRFRSSSNFWLQGRSDNTLWHVSDGVDLGRRALTYDNNRTYFKDNTPGKTPDWIEMEFSKPVKARKVVVYGIDKALRDYEVQILKDGRFVTVGLIKDAKDDRNEFVFPETEFKVLRVYVTRNNGPYTRIAEIEVY